MLNCQVETKGNLLTITVDLSKTAGPSKSGKTDIVASSQGNITVGDVKVGLNVYRNRNVATAA